MVIIGCLAHSEDIQNEGLSWKRIQFPGLDQGFCKNAVCMDNPREECRIEGKSCVWMKDKKQLIWLWKDHKHFVQDLRQDI